MVAIPMRWVVLGLAGVSTVINYIDRQALAVLLPVLRQNLGLTSIDYGTATTLFLVAYTVGQFSSGIFIDHFGTRRGFAWCVAAWSVAAALHALARGPASLFVLRLVLGLTQAGTWPAGTKAVAEWFPKERRALAMGVFDGGSAIGVILAPPMVASLALAWGWRAAFIATGGLGLIWVSLWLKVYRPGPAGGGGPFLPSGLRGLLGLRALWGLMLTRMLATPVWWFYVFWLPDYLSGERGFSLKEIALFGWIPFLAVDIGKIAGGSASDWLLARGCSVTWARKTVMAVGALAMLGGVRVAGAETSAGAIYWVSVAIFGVGLWSANILALHADIFPAGAMGTAIGITGTAASLGGAVFTYATGWIVHAHGYAPAFWIAGTAALGAFLCTVFVLGKVEAVKLAS
ncbi:MAG: MFS transporter [Bryobacteraceae bacterium]|nr:MFS transporter [Bryobacterales bacterium]MEB2363079.1 MFS transporter [Bryobacterales bacterium]NUM99899.1 MFS transporter [Bryobacteraceae bacterium]